MTNVLSATSEDEILVSREFLETRLEERVAQDGLFVLDARQREFLELIAASAATTSGDAIVVPKNLLEAFLAGK